jgi:hypothetical protein
MGLLHATICLLVPSSRSILQLRSSLQLNLHSLYASAAEAFPSLRLPAPADHWSQTKMADSDKYEVLGKIGKSKSSVDCLIKKLKLNLSGQGSFGVINKVRRKSDGLV